MSGGTSGQTPSTPAATPRPLRRAIASHEAHYWFVAKALLASLAPEAPPMRGIRRTRELEGRLRIVLLPDHPDAIAASKTPVGQLGFAHAVEVLGTILGLELPATGFSATLTSAAMTDPEGDDVDPSALNRMLAGVASEALGRSGFVWHWTR